MAGALGLVAEPTLLMGLWAAGAVLGTLLSGGIAGPLAPALAGPALAAVALGARRNLVLAAAVAAVGGAALLSALAARPAQVDAAPWLRAAVLLATSACAALALVRSRPAAEPAETDTDAALRAELAQAQAARAAAEETAEGRARFLAQMSHELRTPVERDPGLHRHHAHARCSGPFPTATANTPS